MDRPNCPDCDYPLRAETGTALNSKTFLVCHMCSKGWDIDKIIDFWDKNPINKTVNQS